MFSLLARVLVVAAIAVAATYAAECGGAPSPNAQPNLNPIAVGPPRFIKAVKNAKLYQVGEGEDIINVVHVWGTPYEMGYAHGLLMNDTASQFFNAVWGYMLNQVEQAINGSVHNLKPWFVDLVSEVGLPLALQLTEDGTRPFTGNYFYEELNGLSAATNVPVQRLIDIHMVGELTQASCSMYGAWGTATPTGGLMQMRALDWDIDGPFQNFPQITVYHPNSGNGHAFANIGWTGWIGSITGMSSQQMAISEIGVSFPDSTFGSMSRIGVPFTFLLRDILQFDNSLEAALDRITNANRTCDLILGVGDAKPAGGFRGIQYSHSVANFYDDTDNKPTASWHPLIKDVVYYGMDWLCPGYDQVLAAQINKNLGNITAENTIQTINAIVQTGDLHIAIYDLSNGILHTANARRDNATGPLKAYERQFVRLNMTTVFSETQ